VTLGMQTVFATSKHVNFLLRPKMLPLTGKTLCIIPEIM